MGGGVYSRDDWQQTRSVRASKSVHELFTQTAALNEYVPANIKGGLRESVDSVDNPQSRPIAIFMDVTGSMLRIPQYMAQTGIGEIMEGLLKHQPVKDPHVLMACFSDAKGDYNPLQVAQFEADNRVAEQAVNFHLGGGGAGDSESYDYPWYFAATQTKTDAWDKRGQKGYLFTMGDEPAPDRVNSVAEMRAVFGDRIDRDYTSQEMLEMAKQKWIVFHIVIEEGARGMASDTHRTWKEMMGPNVLFLNDYTKLAELIVATIAVSEGMSVAQAIDQAGEGKDAVAKAFARLSEFA